MQSTRHSFNWLIAMDAGVLRRDLEAGDRPVAQFRHSRVRRRGQLVQAVAAVDHPSALGAEGAQHLGERHHPLRREHAEELAPRAGRVGQGS